MDVELGVSLGEGLPAGVERDVGNDEGIAGGGDPAGDTFAHVDPQALEAGGVFPNGDGAVEVLGLLVD